MMSPVAVLSNRKTTVEIMDVPATLGRNNGMADIYLFHDSVSGAHCMFECINGKITVRDLGSAAGTFINGVQLESNVPYNLEDGCKLAIGKVKFVFNANYDELARREKAANMNNMLFGTEMRVERDVRQKEISVDAKELSIYEYDESEVVYIDCGLRPEVKHSSYTSELKRQEIEKARREEEKRTQVISKEEVKDKVYRAGEAAPVVTPIVTPVEKPKHTEPVAKVEIPAAAAPMEKKKVLTLSWIDDETGDSKRLNIDRFPFSVGRKSDENDYAIRKKGMSRKHMHFEESGGVIYLVDDNSTNGVSLNGSKVEAGKRCELKEGDSIYVAEITLNVSIK